MPSLGLPIYGQSRSEGLSARRWRSADEFALEREKVPGEFPEGASLAPAGFGRRSFLQGLGAAAGLAGLSACKPPRENVVSFVRPPADVTPSVPNAYATAMSRGGYAVGLVVTSWEGRPTKVEGNRGHPASLGGTDAMLQAEVLELYDPSRARGFLREGRHLSRTGLIEELSELARLHEKDGGARLRFLLEPTSSPRCPSCAAASWRASPRPASTSSPRPTRTRPGGARRWPSAGRSRSPGRSRTRT